MKGYLLVALASLFLVIGTVLRPLEEPSSGPSKNDNSHATVEMWSTSKN
jgi:hypothetical protein